MGSYVHPKQAISCQWLEQLFNQLFLGTMSTRLIGGAEEPLYLPADDTCPYHRLYYREDYLSSALHEIAHWCIAGNERRLQVDFGYWYNPDGRTAQQQQQFEQVEVKPQAVEWHLSVAAGQRFHLSADNLHGEAGASDSFADAVCQQAQQYCAKGLPQRAQTLVEALQQHLGTPLCEPQRYSREQL
ncbi:elongation factor P hydroxylase [Porticoccus sp. W117]|uniref:elongation factor P hydroxylase n=1 Tax=Porticoccus sp. W117 TaxID=3054777 RepID=UPI002595500E|nr:elongation factor P hydroxylase [Porticoccus sp. W117]MDM3872626.1 elongation factor P hydroxylase [Porticoccus sp. W117]